MEMYWVENPTEVPQWLTRGNTIKGIGAFLAGEGFYRLLIAPKTEEVPQGASGHLLRAFLGGALLAYRWE